ncbi:hypothetical protein WJX72_007921 [[Myrmecia] bisecta]|uniref:MSP domain-containing protein n=1 Tax=[Myrmecia] bisecta TaxID=41462 RepID=A0AAW1R8V6_9CHLO
MADLQVSPTELKFKIERGVSSRACLFLHNPSIFRVAFRLRTTNPDAYCCRPTSGIVEPGLVTKVEITLQERKYPDDLDDWNDRFLVVFTAAEWWVKQATALVLDPRSGRFIQGTKVPVALVDAQDPCWHLPAPPATPDQKEVALQAAHYPQPADHRAPSLPMEDCDEEQRAAERARLQELLRRTEAEQEAIKAQLVQLDHAASPPSGLRRAGSSKLAGLVQASTCALVASAALVRRNSLKG